MSNTNNEDNSAEDSLICFVGFGRWDRRAMQDTPNYSTKRLFSCLFRTVNLFCVDGVVAKGRDISGDLRHRVISIPNPMQNKITFVELLV